MRFGSLLTLTTNALVITSLFLSALVISEAQVRTSPSYRLESDSVNFGGGLASSTSYALQSTAGEVATGQSDSSSYSLRAGYQQMQEVFISMTTAAPVVMDNPIGGLTGGTSYGTTSVVVLTDSPSGYQLSIQAESAPAMRKGADTIADYVPAGANPDFLFTTSATEAHFGFTTFGADTALRFQQSGGVCNQAGTYAYLRCWDGLSVSPKTISQSSGGNQPGGATTTINFRVELGNSVSVPNGEYVATTTLTALPL